jgi:hypothetical protein
MKKPLQLVAMLVIVTLVAAKTIGLDGGLQNSRSLTYGFVSE